MKGQLKRKTVRTVHGTKVVRLRIDINYDVLMEHEDNCQDILEWLDKSVDELIRFDIGPFEDDNQMLLGNTESGLSVSSATIPDEVTEGDTE